MFSNAVRSDTFYRRMYFFMTRRQDLFTHPDHPNTYFVRDVEWGYWGGEMKEVPQEIAEVMLTDML